MPGRFKKRFQKKNDKKMPRNKRALNQVIKNVAHKDQERKFYYYQPVVTGTANTSGLKYLLNAMPYDVAIANTPGTRGPGPQQLVGNNYAVKRLRVRFQLAPNTVNALVVRCIIVRETSPEGVPFSTGPLSLVSNIGAGLGCLAPLQMQNIVTKSNPDGRFKVYMDKTITLNNNIASNNIKRVIQFDKTFMNPIKVQTYSELTVYTVATNAVIGNIQNNAFWAVLMTNTDNLTVDQVFCGIDYYDA